MSRTFESLDLVQLPRLDASSAQALGKEVIVAAKGERLPAAVAEALAELTAVHTALERTVALRLPTSAGPDPARTKRADAALDAGWSALHDVVAGWSRAENLRQGTVAATLLPKLFPEGVRFVLLPYKLEWAESSARLRLIKDQGLDRDLDKLACGPILEQVREAHQEYGDALGVTAAVENDNGVANIRDALDTFVGALRDYVVRVAASISKRDPKTRVLAQALLAPIQRWEVPGGGTKVTPAPEPPPPPAPEPSAAQSAVTPADATSVSK